MFEIIMEAMLPKLSQTSLFAQMNRDNVVSDAVRAEISKMKEYRVMPEQIPEIMALMKLNGGPNIKNAIRAYVNGDVIVLYHKDNQKIPIALPFIIVTLNGKECAVVFADKVVSNLNSQREFNNLMATIEAAYYALALHRKQTAVTNNRNIVLGLADLYTRMVTMPLEQKIYMKGDNLTKAMLYTITFFYRIIDGPDKLSVQSIPFKKIISDKVTEGTLKQIIEDVKSLEDNRFMGLIHLIQNINPIRYKDLDAMYLQHFTTACGAPLIFALENPGYLFLLATSADYKTSLTSFNINKTCAGNAKKLIKMLGNL